MESNNMYQYSTTVQRLPPILQVEKQQVTSSATQMASSLRRRNEAHFVCPVPGCGSTFTRRFNLRGFLFFFFFFSFIYSLNIKRSFTLSHRRAPVRLRVAWMSERFCATA